jgi:hypothetical protein
MVDHPRLRGKYQMELAVELTGKKERAIRQMMQRKEWTVSQVIKHYLKLPK